MTADARTAGLLLLLASGVLFIAYGIPGEIFLDFGPNDRRYTRAFREDFEIDGPTFIHWSASRSVVRLPFHLRGPYEVTLRSKRHVARPAVIRVFLGGDRIASFRAPQHDFTLRSFRHESPDASTFEMVLLSRSEDPRPLGLALDWMQVRPAPRFGSALPTPRAFLATLGWVLFFYLASRLLGFGRRFAFLAGLAAALALSALALVHKLWPIHAALTLGWRAFAAAALLIAFYQVRRRSARSVFSRPEAKWALGIVLLGLAIRLFALFHPDFYYPDVRTHSKFVYAMWTSGVDGFFSNHIENQHRHLLGLQYVGDRWVAFPYPPLLYLTIYPLSWLSLPVEDWMMIVPTALLAVEGLVVFVLAQRLGVSPRAAFFAVVLHASARVLAFRLAVASYAALFGHFWDMLAVLYLVFFFERLGDPRYGAGLAALVAVSLWSYAGSALVLGLFIPAFCLAFFWSKKPRPPARRLVAIAGWALFGALVAVASFYAQYVPELFPGWTGGSPPAQATSDLVELRLTPLDALSMAAHRLRLFYGLVFGALTLIALPFLRREKLHPTVFPLVVAALATFSGLNFLRAGLGSTHIFQFSKDDLVVLPLAVIVLGMVIEALARRRGLRVFAAALLSGWIAWGWLGLARDIKSRFIRPGYPPPASEKYREQVRGPLSP